MLPHVVVSTLASPPNLTFDSRGSWMKFSFGWYQAFFAAHLHWHWKMKLNFPLLLSRGGGVPFWYYTCLKADKCVCVLAAQQVAQPWCSNLRGCKRLWGAFQVNALSFIFICGTVGLAAESRGVRKLSNFTWIWNHFITLHSPLWSDAWSFERLPPVITITEALHHWKALAAFDVKRKIILQSCFR